MPGEGAGCGRRYAARSEATGRVREPSRRHRRNGMRQGLWQSFCSCPRRWQSSFAGQGRTVLNPLRWSRPVHSSIAAAGIVACLLLVTFSALMGFIGHSSSGHVHGGESFVSAGHEIPVASSESPAVDGHGEGHAILHWGHDSLSTLGIAPQVACPQAGSTTAGFISDEYRPALSISTPDRYGRLTPVPHLLCVLRA
jgi:hypothetical protein